MILKIVTFFLIGMAVLAMFGKLKVPKIKPKLGMNPVKKCRDCGSYKIGKGPCACKNKKG